MQDSLRHIIEPVFGLPCWQVHQGYGSFLTFEFGEPHLSIHPVRHPKPQSSFRYPSRCVAVRGDWHLWIYCCSWRVCQDSDQLAHCESAPDVIARACAILNGQALAGVDFLPEQGRSRFTFDLGGALATEPMDEELYEQWMLYCPDGHVLTYRSDGAFSHTPGDAPPDETVWIGAG